MNESRLLPWQAGLWAAGCIERLFPYLRARAVQREIAFYRGGLDALWAGYGELAVADAQRIATVGAKLSDLREEYSTEAEILGLLVMVAQAAVRRMPLRSPVTQESVAGLTDAVAESAVQIWSAIGPDNEEWGEREAQAQQDTLAMTGLDPLAAAAQIRIVSARCGTEWAAELSSHDLLYADPQRTRHEPEALGPDLPYRVGDVVEASLPWTATVTTSRSRYDVAVRWPWAVLDPDSEYAPNDSFAFPVDEFSEPWWPYQLRPPAGELREGDPCEVGVPPRRCYVVRAARYDPPMDDGFLPRLTASVALLPAGSGYRDASDVPLERNEPMELILLHRPYAALETGDEVDDADGCRLRFVAPFVFYACDGTRARPAWPLTLVKRGGARADPAAVHAAATATVEGDHLTEIERWRDWSQVAYPAAVAEELFDDS